MAHEENRVDVAETRAAARGRAVGFLRRLRDDVRVGPDERIPHPGVVTEPLDDGEGVADRLMLRLPVARVGPGEHALPRDCTTAAAAASTTALASAGRRALSWIRGRLLLLRK